MPDLPLAEEQPSETLLPDDPAVDDLVDHGKDRFLDVVSEHPGSSLVWALLAEGALSKGDQSGDVSAYAFARTGYHRGLDSLRKHGWRGSGPIPWEHEPNQGFLRSLWALAVAAQRIGEQEEYERCVTFLQGSSEVGYAHLAETRPLTPPEEAGASTETEGDSAEEASDAPEAPSDEAEEADDPVQGAGDSAEEASDPPQEPSDPAEEAGDSTEQASDPPEAPSDEACEAPRSDAPESPGTPPGSQPSP